MNPAPGRSHSPWRQTGFHYASMSSTQGTHLPTTGRMTLQRPQGMVRAQRSMAGCLQALFRPVSMCVPDLALICEIMLMAEGFQASKMLSRKFVILYKLCEDLLSKSQHYDWKLRAIKTTLYVAGGMKRSAPELNEEQASSMG